jgi:hypothetical protein
LGVGGGSFPKLGVPLIAPLKRSLRPSRDAETLILLVGVPRTGDAPPKYVSAAKFKPS